MRLSEKYIRTVAGKLLVVCACACLVLPACGGNGAPRSASLKLMSGLVFVGTAPHVRPTGLSPKLPFVGEHGLESQQLPATLDAGVQYIFHGRLPLDDEQFATSILPARIRDGGLKIVSGPEITFLFGGGTVFKIQFKDGSRVGLIYSSIDERLSTPTTRESWSTHDYVLVFPK